MPAGSWAMFFIACAVAYDITGHRRMTEVFAVLAFIETVATFLNS